MPTLTQPDYEGLVAKLIEVAEVDQPHSARDVPWLENLLIEYDIDVLGAKKAT